MTYFGAASLDDLMREAFMAVRKHGRPVMASRGMTSEITGVILELTDVRARLSRSEIKGKPFSALGEFCWYLSGRSDFDSINYYLPGAYDLTQDVEPDGITISGAYGPRLIRDGQLEQVIAGLTCKPTTRRAVLQLFDATDIASGQRDVPCTCTIQLFNRDDKLEMVTYMRSNDVYLGLPHDVFCFTLLQEWIARRLGVEVGSYKHLVGSLHLYEKHFEQAQRYLDEGFQSTLSPMPSMPTEDVQGAMELLLAAEDALRNDPPDFARATLCETGLNSYWADLVRLLRAYRHSKDHDSEALTQVRDSMASPVYFPFLEQRVRNVATRSSR